MLKKLHQRTSSSGPAGKEVSRNSAPAQEQQGPGNPGSNRGSPQPSPVSQRVQHSSARPDPSGSQSASFSSGQAHESETNAGQQQGGNSPFLARAARYSDSKPPGQPLDEGVRQLISLPSSTRERSKSWNSIGMRPSKVSFSGSACTADNNGHEAHEFQDSELRELILSTLEAHLSRVSYDHAMSAERCKLLTKILESSTRSRLPIDREYKVAALIFMGEVVGEGIHTAAQCTWNPGGDRFAMATYQAGSLFVSAMVMASELYDERSDESEGDEHQSA